MAGETQEEKVAQTTEVVKEPLIAPAETAEETYRQRFISLNKKHEETIRRMLQGEQDRSALTLLAGRLESLENELAQERAEKAVQHIRELLDSGEVEDATEKASILIEGKAKKLGVDLVNDPRLAKVTESFLADDPLSGLKAWNAVEPFLIKEKLAVKGKEPEIMPVPVNPSSSEVVLGAEITLEKLPKEVRDKLEQAILAKHGLHQQVTSQPSGGGGDLSKLSPLELIKIGLEKRKNQ